MIAKVEAVNSSAALNVYVGVLLIIGLVMAVGLVCGGVDRGTRNSRDRRCGGRRGACSHRVPDDGLERAVTRLSRCQL